jgi:hypothetical protein
MIRKEVFVFERAKGTTPGLTIWQGSFALSISNKRNKLRLLPAVKTKEGKPAEDNEIK